VRLHDSANRPPPHLDPVSRRQTRGVRTPKANGQAADRPNPLADHLDLSLKSNLRRAPLLDQALCLISALRLQHLLILRLAGPWRGQAQSQLLLGALERVERITRQRIRRGFDARGQQHRQRHDDYRHALRHGHPVPRRPGRSGGTMRASRPGERGAEIWQPSEGLVLSGECRQTHGAGGAGGPMCINPLALWLR
jgi:hypothetical protein